MTGHVVDAALISIGRLIGKPPGWERVVRALAPPSRFSGRPLRPVLTTDGYEFPTDAGTLIGWNIHFFGSYEPEVRQQLRRWLRPGDTAIDVGANVGWHALLMASLVGAGGRVYAFEPNASTRARLADAVARNALAPVVIEARAVTDHDGAAAFSAPAAGDFWDGTGRLESDAALAAGTVPCTTIDGFVREQSIARVALIKIDVEGWEPTVIAGAQRTLASHRPVLVFEYDPAYIARCGGSGDQLSGALAGAGYRLARLRPRGAPQPVPRLGDADGNYLAVPAERVARGERDAHA